MADSAGANRCVETGGDNMCVTAPHKPAVVHTANQRMKQASSEGSISCMSASPQPWGRRRIICKYLQERSLLVLSFN